MNKDLTSQKPTPNTGIWFTRLCILPVLAWNLQSAFVFLLSPEGFTAQFSLSGQTGVAAVRSLGLLFLMWNIPSIFALVLPFRWRVCLVCAVIQQAIGLGGEIWIDSRIAADPILKASLLRFIQFDSVGLVLLLTALFTTLFSHIRKEISDVHDSDYH